MKGKVKFAVTAVMVAVFVAVASISFAAEPDAVVKGLWLKCPGFPKDAEVTHFRIEPHWEGDEKLSDVAYARILDSALLTFSISRGTTEESEVQGPDDVEALIEMCVWNDEVDEDRMKHNWSAAKIDTAPSGFPQFGAYPHATAEYQLGANEDTRKYVALYIFPGPYRFDVEISVAADWVEDYEDQIAEWLKGLEFVEN